MWNKETVGLSKSRAVGPNLTLYLSSPLDIDFSFLL